MRFEFNINRELQQGKYLVIEKLKIDRGTIIYSALNTATSERIAILTLDLGRIQLDYLNQVKQQFSSVCSQLVKCCHPNIIGCRDYFMEDENCYLVTDAIDGFSLDSVLFRNYPISEKLAINCIQQIIEAVKVFHNYNLFSCNIEPGNIIWQVKKQKFVLFPYPILNICNGMLTKGWCKSLEEYLPLETYFAHSQLTATTNIYQLSAILYSLLTDRVPISAPLRDRIPLYKPQDLRTDLSYQISFAVMKGMSLEAKERPSTLEKWVDLLPKIKSKQRAYLSKQWANFLAEVKSEQRAYLRKKSVDLSPDIKSKNSPIYSFNLLNMQPYRSWFKKALIRVTQTDRKYLKLFLNTIFLALLMHLVLVSNHFNILLIMYFIIVLCWLFYFIKIIFNFFKN